jgi:3-hydroxyisobutyrate dehydrogenase-like beta-hydroxyacid dehydrogenase
MGSAYARNLLAAGHEVAGHDVATERMATLEALGGEPADTNAEVARASDVVLIAVATVDGLREAVAGADGIVSGARQGAIVVEMGTFPLAEKEWARTVLASRGVAVLDAPVSGTGLQAEAREIVIYASGDPAAMSQAQPVFEVLAKAVYDLGEFGNGSKMKYLANLLVSVHNLATAETFVLGKAAGLDPDVILEVISAGVGSSRIFEIRGPMMAADDYPPAARLKMFLKDIDVIGGFARDLGAPTPMLDAALPWYQEAVEAGLGELDAAALARLLADRVSGR